MAAKNGLFGRFLATSCGYNFILVLGFIVLMYGKEGRIHFVSLQKFHGGHLGKNGAKLAKIRFSRIFVNNEDRKLFLVSRPR